MTFKRHLICQTVIIGAKLAEKLCRLGCRRLFAKSIHFIFPKTNLLVWELTFQSRTKQLSLFQINLLQSYLYAAVGGRRREPDNNIFSYFILPTQNRRVCKTPKSGYPWQACSSQWKLSVGRRFFACCNRAPAYDIIIQPTLTLLFDDHDGTTCLKGLKLCCGDSLRQSVLSAVKFSKYSSVFSE